MTKIQIKRLQIQKMEDAIKGMKKIIKDLKAEVASDKRTRRS